MDAREDVRVTVAWLTPAQRQAVELCYFGGLTAALAAVRAGCSPDDMRRRLSDAYRVIRLRLSTGGRSRKKIFGSPSHPAALAPHTL